MQGNVKHLPLAQIREHPDKPVFRKRRVNRPAPDFTGFVIQDNDSVPRRKQQEGVDFTPCEVFLWPVSAPGEDRTRLPLRAGSLAGRPASARNQIVGQPAEGTEAIVVHRRTCPNFPLSCPEAVHR